jgi:integrase
MKRNAGNKPLWSVTGIHDPRYPHIRVRVTELRKTRFVYLGRQVAKRPVYAPLRDADGRKVTRASLGPTTKVQEQRATALALTAIEAIAKAEAAPPPQVSGGPLTLAQLATKYERDGFAGRTEAYKRDALASIRRIAAFLGADTALTDVKPSDVQKYIAHRLGRGVTVAARGDLVALSIAANWAVGEDLCETHPLTTKRARDAMKVAHKPLRPVCSAERYQALKAVAGTQPPAFAVLLDLAWHAGHRISAMLGTRSGVFAGLRWRDVSFTVTKQQPSGSVTWYAGVEPDKKKHEHVVALNAAASAILARWQKETGGVGAAFVFPAEREPTRAVNYDEVKRWLRRAETRAKLSHVKQGGWHAFRRGWATARKHLPLKDVQAAGGWDSADGASVLACYQHEDEETTRQVATHVA